MEDWRHLWAKVDPIVALQEGIIPDIKAIKIDRPSEGEGEGEGGERREEREKGREREEREKGREKGREREGKREKFKFKFNFHASMSGLVCGEEGEAYPTS